MKHNDNYNNYKHSDIEAFVTKSTVMLINGVLMYAPLSLSGHITVVANFFVNCSVL
jgi:hypothetical protein